MPAVLIGISDAVRENPTANSGLKRGFRQNCLRLQSRHILVSLKDVEHIGLNLGFGASSSLDELASEAAFRDSSFIGKRKSSSSQFRNPLTDQG